MPNDDDHKLWVQVSRHVIETFDEKLMTLAHPEIRRLIWAAYLAAQDGKSFFVGDALHSMSVKGTPKPKRALDDPNYSSKYKRLERVKGKHLLQVVSVRDNGRNKLVRPTEKLNNLMSELYSSTMRLLRPAALASESSTPPTFPFDLQNLDFIYFSGHGATAAASGPGMVWIDCCAQGPSGTIQH